MFLPNTDSFVLIQRSIVKPNARSDFSIFLPNTDSFVLIQKSVITPNTGPDFPVFLPNTDSFVLIRRSIVEPKFLASAENVAGATSQSTDKNNPKVNDQGKRTFLKVASITGAGIVASQLLPKKAQALIMGSSPTTGVVGVKNAANTRINPATEETASTLATEATASTLLKTDDLTFDVGSGALEVKVSEIATTASTETTLQTISFGGFKFALKMTTVGSVDYIGEAAAGTAASSALWRAKKVDSTSGIIITWADGNANFDNVATDLTTLTYS
jgi:hypothetical protein